MLMKRNFLFFIVVFYTFTLQAQTGKYKNQIEVSSCILVNDIVRFSKVEEGMTVKNGEGFRIGLTFDRRLNQKLFVVTGFNYLQTSNPFDGNNTAPDDPSQKSMILQFPLGMRYTVKDWLYFKSGISIDSQFNNKEGEILDNQSGIGFFLNGGIHLSINNRLHYNIEPGFNFTSLIPFKKDDHHQHFFLSGINFNIGYTF